MVDILKNIKEELPKVISDASFEGANIVIYTEDKDFFRTGETKVKEIVDKIKKRIELRAEKSILASEDETEKTIRALVPEEAEITNIIFDVQLSSIIIEAKKPGLVIGKQGSILNDIKRSTFWSPSIRRSPIIPSKITEKIRSVLYANNNYRRKFLNDIGKKIYKDWSPEKMDMWIRVTYLGSGRQVGRSCLLLHTPNSKVLLDCGINPGIAEGQERFPYLNVSEIGDINSIDAIILSHAHTDHCLPPDSLVLTKQGYKKIDDIKEGEEMISMDWNTGKYVSSKCLAKTNTTGHKKILKIKTPYSSIESSPNHRFFTFENLQLRELEASELKKGMLLPSNLLHKPVFQRKNIYLDTNVEYDKRRKDNTNLPKELTPQLAEFLGYYLGDGHESSLNTLRLTDASTQILEHHKSIIKSIFNYEGIIRHHSDKSKNAFILEINNAKIIRFLKKNFKEIYLKTNYVVVPEKIKEASKEVQCAFLRGFSDAEGTFTDVVKITSFSKKMLDDLQYLLSLQRIPSTLSLPNNSSYIESKYGMTQFYNKGGFSMIYKQEKLKRKIERLFSSDFNKQDLLPFTSNDLRIILKEAGMLGRVHNSPKLLEILLGGLLDLFRGNTQYATRSSVIKLIDILKSRIATLQADKNNTNIYSLRQLLSVTRNEISLVTGLKNSQIQQVEENRWVSQVFLKFTKILHSFMKEKLESIIFQIQKNIQILENLLAMNITWEKITKLEEKENSYPYLVDIETSSKNFIAGNIIVHNSALIPYLFKMGYRGPVYLTEPTRDISALLALDFIGVAYKQASSPLYKAEDIKEMVRHSICLDYGVVYDITPDMRITFYNAGHVLGSAQVHINIGNGLHNFVYGADTKYGKTRLLDPAVNHFPRIETLTIEATYGGKDDLLPPRKEAEDKFIEMAKRTIERGGKILLPELGLGHAQETLLRVEESIRTGTLPKVPVYIDGMIWDITAIHTAYPDFLSSSVRNQIFQDNNPFISDIFKRVGSPAERKEVIEGGPCIIIATSGMLVGGASVEYFKNLADNPNNLIVFGCYQAIGSTGRQVQEGAKEATLTGDSWERIQVKLEVQTLSGLSAHSGRNELVQYVSRMNPKPKKIIVNHGEVSKCLDLASTLYKQHKIETIVPRNLETIRLK